MITDASVQNLLDALAGAAATPGGGSAVAIMGAMGAALVSMVCILTIGKQDYVEVEDQMKAVLNQAQAVRARLTSMIDEDVRAYGSVMGAYALPRRTASERAIRSDAIQAALMEATRVPLACARACGEVMELSRIVAERGNRNAAGEAGVAVVAAHAALRGAALNVYINTSSIRNASFVESTLTELVAMMRGRDGLDANVYELVTRRLTGGAERSD